MDPIMEIIDSQTPWMVLSIVLIAFIIKLQNDKLTQMCMAMSNLMLLYEKHDKQAKDIKYETSFIRDWCVSHGADVNCKPTKVED